MTACSNCGRELPEGAFFCPDCGASALAFSVAQTDISPSHFNSGMTATSPPLMAEPIAPAGDSGLAAPPSAENKTPSSREEGNPARGNRRPGRPPRWTDPRERGDARLRGRPRRQIGEQPADGRAALRGVCCQRFPGDGVLHEQDGLHPGQPRLRGRPRPEHRAVFFFCRLG